jgi:gelsolin
MPPHEGLVHLKEYDVKDSNVELIGSDIDHRVKYNSAATEPAWNDGKVGLVAGLRVWRIENFAVVSWSADRFGQFYDGDSYIVLHSYKVGRKDEEKLGHDIFFWLGRHTSQDEAGTAAYKTVELDEFLEGHATQHREVQQQPSDAFVALFPRLSILSGGVNSGFRHVSSDDEPKKTLTLLRIFKYPAAGRTDPIIVHEVVPSWESLDEADVFVLDRGDKIFVWQGKHCSPMEKAKAAQVVHDLREAKHVDVEVLSQAESRSKIVVDMLGGKDLESTTFRAPRPLAPSKWADGKGGNQYTPKLFSLSDESGTMSFKLVKDGNPIKREDLDSDDIFLLDSGNAIWVWQGSNASKGEKAMWTNVAQSYARRVEDSSESDEDVYLTPISKVVEGHESPAFLKALSL